MSIYIKGMEMPKKCALCQAAFPNGVDFSCCLIKGYPIIHHDVRLRDCPFIPVPGHGRLIDADVLYEMVKERTGNWAGGWSDIMCVLTGKDIKEAPTIIPEDKGGEA